MTVGSIENEKEFLDSKVWLEVWLEGHRTNESQLADIRHNAAVLQDCDEKPPSPQGEMAGVSQTRPSQLVAAVHLCTRGHESHDQDKIQRSCYPLHVHVAIICHNGPAERDQIGREKKDCHEKSSVICSMGYWSETVDHVTDTCESEGQKNNRERFCYHAHASSQYTIQTLQRRGKDDTPIYCLQCNQDDRVETCLACSDLSPVPRFVRIRTITFTPINGGTHRVVVKICCYGANVLL